MENIILFVVFAPFRYFLLFLIVSIVSLILHPTRDYGRTDPDVAGEVKKIDEILGIICFISLGFALIFAIICLFYYIKF